MRQTLDPDLEGTVQHRWMGKAFNIAPETFWSGLRMTFTPGFEELIENGIAQGWYNYHNALQR